MTFCSPPAVDTVLLLDAERSQRLHQTMTNGESMPTLKSVFGRVHLLSGYGLHTVTRSLPTLADTAAHLQGSWFDVTTTDPDLVCEAFFPLFAATPLLTCEVDLCVQATIEEPNNSAWWLVVPQNENGVNAWDAEPMSPFVRGRQWAYIIDAGRDNLKIPRCLEWATSPRAREYMNMREEHLDLDYFATAYGGLAATRAIARMKKLIRAIEQQRA